jgi:hypothetical protein
MTVPLVSPRIAASFLPLVLHTVAALLILLRGEWAVVASRASTFLVLVLLSGVLSAYIDYRLRMNVLLDWKLR